jgi:hypothetical protein
LRHLNLVVFNQFKCYRNHYMAQYNLLKIIVFFTYLIKTIAYKIVNFGTIIAVVFEVKKVILLL